MTGEFAIERATAADAEDVAVMVEELLGEIMTRIGAQAFEFDLAGTVARLEDWLGRETYFAFVARDPGGRALGFVTLCESYALYAGGTFGTIPELYVRPQIRSQGLGQRLLSRARSYGISRGWRRLEVTTPHLPEFEKTLTFYERNGFEVTGGRKLKAAF